MVPRPLGENVRPPLCRDVTGRWRCGKNAFVLKNDTKGNIVL